jgi:hypothetical protein
LIEIKAKPERSSNLQRKFDKTGRAVQAVLGEAVALQAELHVKPLPKTTQRYRYAPLINGRRVRVQLYAGGRQV